MHVRQQALALFQMSRASQSDRCPQTPCSFFAASHPAHTTIDGGKKKLVGGSGERTLHVSMGSPNPEMAVGTWAKELALSLG